MSSERAPGLAPGRVDKAIGTWQIRGSEVYAVSDCQKDEMRDKCYSTDEENRNKGKRESEQTMAMDADRRRRHGQRNDGAYVLANKGNDVTSGMQEQQRARVYTNDRP